MTSVLGKMHTRMWGTQLSYRPAAPELAKLKPDDFHPPCEPEPKLKEWLEQEGRETFPFCSTGE